MMGTQLSLGQSPKPPKVPKEPWHRFIARCEREGEKYQVLVLRVGKAIDLTGAAKWIKYDEYTGEGYWGTKHGRLEGDLKEELIKYKSSELRKPYLGAGHLLSCRFTRTTKAKNIKIFATFRARALLAGLGIDFNLLTAELDTMPENPATPEILEQLKTHKKLELRLKRLGKEREMVERLLSGRYYYSRKPKPPLHLIGVGKRELERERERLSSAEESLRKKLAKMHEKFGEKDEEWGDDEEWED